MQLIVFGLLILSAIHSASANFCTADVKECLDGSFVKRDPQANCTFFPCPTTVKCTQDVHICPGSGKAVKRIPEKNCDFDDCPEPKACTRDAKACPDGSMVFRDMWNDCKFKPCGNNSVKCTQDVHICPGSGKAVKRNPEKNCDFDDCPKAKECKKRWKRCILGKRVEADPYNNCKFPKCPKPKWWPFR